MADIKGLFFAEENIFGDRHDGWWVMMHEPPTEDCSENGMIIFTGLPSEESANHFIERFEAAIKYYLEGKASS